MANINVPGKPFLVRSTRDTLRIKWQTPVTRGFGWNVYAGIEGTGAPLPGPALNSAVLPTQTFLLALTDVAGNNPPGNDLEVAITSVNLTTGEESAQSILAEFNVDALDPGIPNRVLVGRSPSGAPMYLATDEDGRLYLSADTSLTINKCVLSNNQQTDVTVGTTAVDILAAPQIPAPLAARKMVIVQNRGNKEVLLGTSALQNHVVPAGGTRILTADEIAVGMWARVVSAPSVVLNVWEYN